MNLAGVFGRVLTLRGIETFKGPSYPIPDPFGRVLTLRGWEFLSLIT